MRFFGFLENIALHKSAWQLHPYVNLGFKYNVDASKAVDGLKTNLSSIGQQCTISGYNQEEALWRVDLGTVLGIHHITIYYRTENWPWGRHHESFYFLISLKRSPFHKGFLRVFGGFWGFFLVIFITELKICLSYNLGRSLDVS